MITASTEEALSKNVSTTFGFQLLTLSPIHIGSGDSINKGLLYLDQAKNKIYILKENGILCFLNSHSNQVLQKYLEALARPALNFYKWIEENQLKNPFLANLNNLTDYIVNYESYEDNGIINDYRPCVKSINPKNNKEEPYIPGSSIKGYVLSSIIYSRVLSDKNIKNELWDKIKLSPKDALNEYLSRFNVPLTSRQLLISDAYSVSPITVSASDHIYLSLKERAGEQEKSLPLTREYIPPSTKLYFSITLTLNRYKELQTPFAINLETILQQLENFTGTVLSLYESEYQNYCLSEEIEIYDHGSMLIPNLFIGGGTSFFLKSLLPLISPSIDEYKKFIKNIEDTRLQFLPKIRSSRRNPQNRKNHKHVPNTIKFTNDSVIPGWCRITRIK